MEALGSHVEMKNVAPAQTRAHVALSEMSTASPACMREKVSACSCGVGMGPDSCARLGFPQRFSS